MSVNFAKCGCVYFFGRGARLSSFGHVHTMENHSIFVSAETHLDINVYIHSVLLKQSAAIPDYLHYYILVAPEQFGYHMLSYRPDSEVVSITPQDGTDVMVFEVSFTTGEDGTYQTPQFSLLGSSAKTYKFDAPVPWAQGKCLAIKGDGLVKISYRLDMAFWRQPGEQLDAVKKLCRPLISAPELPVPSCHCESTAPPVTHFFKDFGCLGAYFANAPGLRHVDFYQIKPAGSGHNLYGLAALANPFMTVLGFETYPDCDAELYERDLEADAAVITYKKTMVHSGGVHMFAEPIPYTKAKALAIKSTLSPVKIYYRAYRHRGDSTDAAVDLAAE